MPSLSAISALADQLVSGSAASDRQKAAATLKALAFDDSAFAILREANAVGALVQALRTGHTSPIAQLAADAVWSLSADDDNKPILLAAGIIPILSQLLYSLERTPIVHSAASTLSNLVDVETGVPHQVGAELLTSGGVEALVNLLPKDDAAPPWWVSDELSDEELVTQLAVSSVLAATAVNLEVCNEIRQGPGDAIVRLVKMLRGRTDVARHAAAILARVASSSPAGLAAVRDAGSVAPLIALCREVLDKGATSDADMQAAQHAAGALWILAGNDQTSREQMLATDDAIGALAAMVTGRLGGKAEGNAAGALLALSITSNRASRDTDPVTVMSGVLEKEVATASAAQA